MIPLVQARTQIWESLGALARAAVALHAENVVAALQAEEARMQSSRFTIVLVGERNTGKSTLANALVGQDVLPARPVPTTGLVHELTFGEVPAAVLRTGGEERPLELTALATLSEGGEALGAISAREAVRVVLQLPSEPLRGGVSILDTPGTNDLSALGAEVTYGVLPEADAVLVVLDATQPLRRSERDFLAHRLPWVARERAVLVLNRADLLGVSELEEAQAYVRKQLDKLLPDIPFIAVSAKAAGERGDKGLGELREFLAQLVGKDRVRLSLLRSAGEGLRLGEALRDHLRLRKDAQKLSAADLEARLLRLQRQAGGHKALVHEACAKVDVRAHEIAAEAVARLADFTEQFRVALPREIDAAEESDLRKYLPFFLEDTLRKFAEGEAARVEAAMASLAYEVLSEFSEHGERAAADLDLGPNAPVRVEVDTSKYDVGVVAAGALGTILLFQSPLVGILLLAGAPVLSHVLKGKMAGRVREVAKEQALAAVEAARSRLADRLREEILASAARLREAVLNHGESAEKGAELALGEALAARQAGTAPASTAELEALVEGACRDLGHLGETLAEQG